MCGENSALMLLWPRGAGSSPRVRGKLPILRHQLTGSGLIPACAGKTNTRHDAVDGEGAHPRVCGENSALARKHVFEGGSSPRVRGKRGSTLSTEMTVGLIPACAGKTNTLGYLARGRKAHPRVCGENLLLRSFLLLRSGSSPRVRGKRGEGGQGLESGRLIPACAGKTSSLV